MDNDGADERPILIAFDGSGHARCAAHEAARLFPGRRAIVVTGWRSVESAVAAAVIAVPAGVAKDAQVKIDAESKHEAHEQAERGATIVREAGMEAEARAIQAGNAIWRAIVASADADDIAAIVVGSRGRSGIKSALLGSVSTGVVQHSARPVLVVHETEGEPR